MTYNIDLNGNGDRDDEGEVRQINLWQYAPAGSEQPLMYFDVSRRDPYSPFGDPPASYLDPDAGEILALKQLREGKTEATTLEDVVFVNNGKFQIIHCGLDGAWGSFGLPVHSMTDVDELGLLFPTGPFIGDTADTLSNFMDGTLEDEAEE